MKKRKEMKKKSKDYKVLNELIKFGNRKEVFWRITIATMILTAIGIPIIMTFKTDLNNALIRGFILLWFFEISYIWMYFDRKRRIKREGEIRKKIKKSFGM